jgi:DNA-binding transcriptional ArsR family regulator
MSLSTGFFENTVMLLMTAVLTSVLVPLLFRRIDERRNQKQKIFEAELSRQSKIIDAQVELLDNLSNLLWEFQLLLISVPYYHQFPERNLYPIALKNYEENSSKLLSKIRAEISKALRLTPPSIYQELKKLYYQKLLPLDLELSQLALRDKKQQGKISEWRKLNHYAVHELSEDVDNIIDKLANDLNLKARSSILASEEELEPF